MKAKIFSIDGRNEFTTKIIDKLNEFDNSYNLDLGDINVETFSDGEFTVQYKEYVRGHKVFLVCSTISSDNIMKLMLASDAARRASAEEIIAVIPYFGYSRQDRKDGLRGAVGAKVVANMLIANGIDRMITIDLHADQIQGFFNIPVDHITGDSIFLSEIRNMIDLKGVSNVTLCSPDAGGVKRVNYFFKKLIKLGYNVEMAMFSKMRDKPNQIARLDLIGDVKGRDVIIIDDMVDTAGTLCGTAHEIMKAGANSVRAICTHGILSGPAIERINESELTELIISDSVEYDGSKSNKIKSITCTERISYIIEAICEARSADILMNPI